MFVSTEYLKNKLLHLYHIEYTGSHPITEVKPQRAWLVPGWVKYRVLFRYFVLASSVVR